MKPKPTKKPRKPAIVPRWWLCWARNKQGKCPDVPWAMLIRSNVQPTRRKGCCLWKLHHPKGGADSRVIDPEQMQFLGLTADRWSWDAVEVQCFVQQGGVRKARRVKS